MMRFKITIAALLIALGCLAFGTAEAQADPPCSEHVCLAHLTATTHVRHWQVRGAVGEAWLLYLNIFEAHGRLGYRALPGGCDASYGGLGSSAVLHACGLRSRLAYVAFRGKRRLRIEYRYVKR